MRVCVCVSLCVGLGRYMHVYKCVLDHIKLTIYCMDSVLTHMIIHMIFSDIVRDMVPQWHIL